MPFITIYLLEKATPPAIQSAVDIIQYSIHYLSVGEAPVRSKVLDCLELVLVALNHVDESMKFIYEIVFFLLLEIS